MNKGHRIKGLLYVKEYDTNFTVVSLQQSFLYRRYPTPNQSHNNASSAEDSNQSHSSTSSSLSSTGDPNQSHNSADGNHSSMRGSNQSHNSGCNFPPCGIQINRRTQLATTVLPPPQSQYSACSNPSSIYRRSNSKSITQSFLCRRFKSITQLNQQGHTRHPTQYPQCKLGFLLATAKGCCTGPTHRPTM